MKYWWSQDHSHKFLVKSETKFFFEIEGSPLWIEKIFWLRFWWNSKFLILMALASYIQNFSKIGDKNFFDIEGSPLWIFQKIRYLLNDFRGKWSAGHTSRYQNIIKLGLNLTFHMVTSVASRPKIHGQVNVQRKKCATPPDASRSSYSKTAKRYKI